MSTHAPAPQPEEYQTGKGCLSLILLSAGALLALTLFVVLFGNVSA